MTSFDFDFSKVRDERLVGAFVEANLPFLRQRASRFVGKNGMMDQDDLVQEAAIGFVSAVVTFDPEKNVSFRQYAGRCVDNRLKSVYLSQKRQKRIPAGDLVPLNEELVDSTISIPRSEQVVNPEELVIVREGFQSLLKQINSSLSDFEREVLALYLYGCSSSELSVRLHVTPKQIDNAMQRVRRKCRVLVND